ncbi:MAG: YqgE/AlgH family protein, partial [Gammaproteobacteria bacterium]
MDLTNQFLIAMPALQDPNFHRTVTYLCAHNNEGAMGIVINRPLDLNLGEILGHMSIEVDNIQVNEMMVLQGGPVQRDRGFVIHEPAGEWDAVLTVGDD